MTVSVTLTFPDLQSADAVLHRLAARGEPVAQVRVGGMLYEDFPQQPGPAPRPHDSAEAHAAAPEEPPVLGAVNASPAASKRRGRPPKAVYDSHGTEATPAPAPAAVAVITKERALAKFKAVHDAKGLPVCLTVLTRLGAKRFAEVKPEQYSELIELCDRAIDGEDLTKASE